MQFVVSKIKQEFFGVEASKVSSINDMMTITKVPNAPMHIKGLINLRGIIIAVFDIAVLLNIENYQKESNYEDSNIIILDMEDEEIGIIVNKVDEVLDIEENCIKKSVDNKIPFIKGVIELKDKLITLIDINKFITNN